VDDDGSGHLVPMHLGSGDRAKLGDLVDLMSPTVLTLLNTSTSMDITNIYVPPPEPEPEAEPIPVYCDEADVARALGLPASTPGSEKLQAAAIYGSRYVDLVIGNEPAPSVGPPYTTLRVPCEPAWTQGAIVAAVRFTKSPDVPFGAAGGLGDLAVYVRGTSIPEVDLLLTGHRQAFGIG
jgi:hypothetical protein